MSDNSTQGAPGGADESAVAEPESGATAATEDENKGAQAGEEGAQEPRTFTQEEFEKALQKERAKSERAIRREFQQQVERAAQPAPQAPPNKRDFNSPEDYAEALADYKVEQKLAEREQREYANKVTSTYEERAEEARTKYDDFEQVAHTLPRDGGPTITDYMADAIMESEMGPEVAYYLGKNTAESRRIARMSPLGQAREIGKIEAGLIASPPPAKKTTSAPAPIRPLGGNPTTHNVSPTDPRSDKMSISEWMKARDKELRSRG